MDGFECTKKIRSELEKDVRTPIIAFTANVFADDIQKCKDAGMVSKFDHVSQPISPTWLFVSAGRFPFKTFDEGRFVGKIAEMVW